MSKSKPTPGIEERHARSCPSRNGERCACSPTWQAHVYDARTAKRIRRTFPTKTAAKLWRADAVAALRHGTLAEAQPKTTLREACDAWIADAKAGVARTRAGDPFKPATIRAYHQALRLRVYPTLAEEPFYRLRRATRSPASPSPPTSTRRPSPPIWATPPWRSRSTATAT
ncbi:MAG: hypothetical protein M3459_07815 [Actinomycetota bacterium]|nr:hypothetical protein [Actinomycetota bacterium]